MLPLRSETPLPKIPPGTPPLTTPFHDSSIDKCSFCGIPTHKHCGQCGFLVVCSIQCQKHLLPHHRVGCHLFKFNQTIGVGISNETVVYPCKEGLAIQSLAPSGPAQTGNNLMRALSSHRSKTEDHLQRRQKHIRIPPSPIQLGFPSLWLPDGLDRRRHVDTGG